MSAAVDPLPTHQAIPSGFRMELRNRTHDDHRRLDAMISGFDVSDREGLKKFLHLNAIGFQTLAPYAPRSMVRDIVKALLTDLHALTGAPPAIPSLSFAPADSLAATYILAGSRLGTQVLAQQWRTSGDDRVLAASAYFTHPHDSGGWQDVCRQLDRVPSGSDRAERIVSDTMRIYGLFESACRLTEAKPPVT